ncbi:heme-binding beta-barrel domain-containing protein [Vibrio gangliei]|uniref:heme-binding beta-barrel domain-containing protein n=1 Tax=Vibrio gangliei TaxID=2077090 RepID=UPI000D01A190|nr:heme-binding beta-barrel domain-containing protein [Vibrio gangliei]
MKKKLLVCSICSVISISSFAAEKTDTVINGMDFGPLASLVGTWKSTDSGGIDIAPARPDTETGAGAPAVSPYYEITTIEVAADAVNAGKQNLVALYYKMEMFKKADDTKFHDQRGYFIYDKANNMAYNTFCVPRNTCVTSEGKVNPGDNKISFVASPKGIAESSFMEKNASTTGYSMTINIDGDNLTINQNTHLKIYGKDFNHSDTSPLVRVKAD